MVKICNGTTVSIAWETGDPLPYTWHRGLATCSSTNDPTACLIVHPGAYLSAFSGMHQTELVGGLLFLPIESGFFALHLVKGVTDHCSFSTSLKGSRKSERLIRAVVAVSVVEASCSSPVSDLAVN